ncbi:CotH protein [Roseateles sp. YR242]|uniref:CotH kinase family protein n=1 Tax=Roseateles sp. YR242 TaxID=1855305 RepID=UPI0008BD60E5|nr:CotH kinase family protein [Roseateles sp. YR242]SEK57514.1 CotH protein [Roseateles sp. YR242]
MTREGGHKVGLAIALAVCGLSACGGGEPDRILSGQLSHPEGLSWKVCLDSNANLSCEASETSVMADTTGSFRITLPHGTTLENKYLVAEQVTAVTTLATAGTFRLSAPATATAINGLTSLVVTQWRLEPSAGLTAAVEKISTLFGLTSSADLLKGYDSSVYTGVDSIVTSSQTALQTGTQAYIQLAQEAPAGNAGRASAQAADDVSTGIAALTDQLGRKVLAIIGRYVDADNGRMLPTVTSRTINEEVNQAINPSQCNVNTPLPIYIDTVNNAPIDSKETYVSARLRTATSAAYGDAIDVDTSIRGRGNTTWEMPKKPYKLKLGKAASLLGMAADKEWALLANYADKTLLRNAVAFCLGTTTGLAYTPNSRFVELTLNGQYAGVYQLVETIKTAGARVEIGSDAPTDTDPAGFLLEIDSRLDADDWFYSATANVPYTIQSDVTESQIPLIQQVIARFEQTLFADDFAAHKAGGYTSQLDTEALVDFYLINELLKNNDAFFSSTFVTRKNNGPLVFGPLWDFDLTAGNINYNGNDSVEGWWVRGASAYVTRLLQDPVFAKHVTARWAYLSSRMPDLQRFIASSAVTLDGAQARNFQTWDILNTYVWPNAVVTGSYSGEINYLSTWLKLRTAWMDTQFVPAVSAPQRVSSSAGRL